MTRIDFYVLATKDPHDRRVLACRLTEKAWRQGLKVYIHTSSETETGIIDNLLWTFRQGSFIPHEKTTASPDQREDIDVLIGTGGSPEDFRDLIINLSTEIPPGIADFKRVAELVDEDDTVRAGGRQRYATYKQQGYELETHRL